MKPSCRKHSMRGFCQLLQDHDHLRHRPADLTWRCWPAHPGRLPDRLRRWHDEPAPEPVKTPVALTLEKIGSYGSGVSARARPRSRPSTPPQEGLRGQRRRRQGRRAGSDRPDRPVKIGELDAGPLLPGAEINSVAVGTAWLRSPSGQSEDRPGPHGAVPGQRPEADQPRRRRRPARHADLHPTEIRCWWPTRASRATTTRSTPRARSA